MTHYLSCEAVVKFRKRDESSVHRKIVSGIGLLQPESAVEVQNQATSMTLGQRPVQSDRSSQDESHACHCLASGGRRGGQPQPSSSERLQVRRAEVLSSGDREAQFAEGPSADANIETAIVPKKLDSQSDGADPTSRDAYAHTLASTRPLARQRGVEHGAKDGDDDSGSGHGSIPARLLASLGVKCAKRLLKKRRIIEPRALWVHGIWRVAVVAAWLPFSACASPDRPVRLDHTLPDALLEWLEPDSARTVLLHPGVVYRYLWSSKGPWAIHMVQASIGSGCNLGFEVLHSDHDGDGGSGRKTVSAMTAGSEQRVLAAINADFFTPGGNPVGVEVVNGEVQATAVRPTFAWKPGAQPWIGVSQITTGGLQLGWSIPTGEGDGETQAVSGFPDLIDGGQRVGDLEVQARPSFAAARHPRSAIGYKTVSEEVWIVLVDGRQHLHSVGMTLPEMARLFESAGVDEALNLDGGGSSALVLGQALVNRPSDPTGERAVVNALALITNLSWCEAN